MDNNPGNAFWLINCTQGTNMELMCLEFMQILQHKAHFGLVLQFTPATSIQATAYCQK